MNSDFLLVLLRDMVHTYPELRVVLMSATIDTSLFSSYFGSCPVVEVPGRVHPVQEYFLADCIQMTNFLPEPVQKKNNGGPDDDRTRMLWNMEEEEKNTNTT